jgi:hypothetical protein
MLQQLEVDRCGGNGGLHAHLDRRSGGLRERVAAQQKSGDQRDPARRVFGDLAVRRT